ncbi:MAG: hypothetical protein KA035_00320 [Candidatus Levybacteria bacterium]|nr:hypothetical protein [Candidatus Levybacteria bacterium]
MSTPEQIHRVEMSDAELKKLFESRKKLPLHAGRQQLEHFLGIAAAHLDTATVNYRMYGDSITPEVFKRAQKTVKYLQQVKNGTEADTLVLRLSGRQADNLDHAMRTDIDSSFHMASYNFAHNFTADLKRQYAARSTAQHTRNPFQRITSFAFSQRRK